MTRFAMNALAIALLVMLGAIVVQVFCSVFDINPIWTFDRVLPFVGKAVTLNSLLDFQWHLLVVIGLLPAGLVWLRDQHVRVDFLYSGRSDRSKSRIDILGNLIFAGPFFAMMAPASWDFLLRAWRSGEGSRNDGINDLWLVKAVLPIGIALLALAVLIETIRLIRAAR